jgi:transcriptional regulator with XRE-family HTH domain
MPSLDSEMPLKTKPTHTPQYRQILAGLRRARKEAGLTQAQVAACFERPQSFVSKCESGDRRIDPTELNQFAKLYRKPVSRFLDEPASPRTPPSPGADPRRAAPTASNAEPLKGGNHG